MFCKSVERETREGSYQSIFDALVTLLQFRISENEVIMSQALAPTFNALVSFSHNVFKNLLHESSLTLVSIYTYFNTIEKKSFKKTLWKKVKLLKMSNFTFFHNVFYAICILKSFNSHISVVVCSFFEFGMVSKWCIREWVNKG